MIVIFKYLWKLLLLVSKVLFFAVFFLLSLINSQDVTFHWFIDKSLSVPLMFVILGAFLLGMLMSGFAFYRLNTKRNK